MNQDQVMLCGLMVLSAERCEETVRQAYPGEAERQHRAMQALHLYDAYLGVVDAARDDSSDPMMIVGFKGFLAVELDMPKQDRIATVWSVSDLLTMYGVIEESSIPFALSQSELFDKQTYLSKHPSQAWIDYYDSWFRVAKGQGVHIDLTALDPDLSLASKQFLREKLGSYLADKNKFEAQTDAGLIIGILQGYVAEWPSRDLSGGPLSPTQTSSFIAQITDHSNRLMAQAGFSQQDAEENLGYVLNVIHNFFIPSGIFATLDRS